MAISEQSPHGRPLRITGLDTRREQTARLGQFARLCRRRPGLPVLLTLSIAALCCAHTPATLFLGVAVVAANASRGVVALWRSSRTESFTGSR